MSGSCKLRPAVQGGDQSRAQVARLPAGTHPVRPPHCSDLSPFQRFMQPGRRWRAARPWWSAPPRRTRARRLLRPRRRKKRSRTLARRGAPWYELIACSVIYAAGPSVRTWGSGSWRAQRGWCLQSQKTARLALPGLCVWRAGAMQACMAPGTIVNS
jgi:hypothetical protein